ncbi:aspartate aminotransferase, partial [Rubrivivax gelatinosus]|nr:aspartate aminotransferase [Rubrivivax gelatinosus]
YRQVIITTGSQQSLDLTCRMLVDPGDPVWLEEPGYLGARSVIRANGGVVCPVPVDDEGICVEGAEVTHPVPSLIYVSPARQYPLGMTLSVPRREALLRYARASGAWVIEDDYDYEFRYQGHSPQAVHGMDKDSRTIHIGTFSKILLPSFRLGYMVVPPDLSEAFGKARAIVDRHASLIEQMVLSEFMHRGLLVSHIRRMRGLYRARQLHLIAGLQSLLGQALPLAGTDTGMHLTLPLAPEAGDVALTRRAAQLGITLRPLTPYYATRQRRQGLLLGFAAFNNSELDLGLQKLAPMKADLARLLQRQP